MKTKSVSPRRVSLAMISSLLVVIAVLTTVLLNAPVKVAQAAVPSGGIVNGIDYSGQGTELNGEIAPGQAMVSGNYVNIPIYKGRYDTAWYNVNDWWIWHPWSSWSLSNNKTNDYDTYVGKTMTEYDVDSKTENMYYRYNPLLTPIWKRTYYTKYETITKILFINVKTYNTVSSSDSYPKAVSGKTIVEQWIEESVTGYRGGNEFTDWRDSAPITLSFWPFNEPSYSVYASRTNYRYRSRTIEWNSKASTTIEQVPLNYSLYNKAGEPINYGAVWTYSQSLSSEKAIPGSVTLAYRYMLNSAGIKQLLNGKENALDQLIKDQGTSWWEVAIGAAVGLATLKANPYVGGAVFVVETLYAVMGKVVAENMKNKYDNLKELLIAAQDYKINIIFEYYQTTIHTLDGGENYSNMKEFATARNYISMKYQNNESPSTGYFLKDTYGMVSYMQNTSSLINDIESYVKLKSLSILVY
jgi:hypothetical protein